MIYNIQLKKIKIKPNKLCFQAQKTEFSEDAITEKKLSNLKKTLIIIILIYLNQKCN